MCKTRAIHFNPPFCINTIPACLQHGCTDPGWQSQVRVVLGICLLGCRKHPLFWFMYWLSMNCYADSAFSLGANSLQRCLLDYTFSFSWFLLEYTTFHCLALESQLHKKNECSLFYSTEECSLPISSDDDFFSCSRNRKYSVESFTSDTCSAHLFPCLLSHLSCGFPLDLKNTALRVLSLLL